MTDEPTTKPDPTDMKGSRTQSGASPRSGSQPSSPSSSSTRDNPPHHEFDDRTKGTSNRPDASKANDKSTKSDYPRFGERKDDDAGESQRSPRTDVTTASSDNRSQGDHPHPSNPQNEKKQGSQQGAVNSPNQQPQKTPKASLHGNSGGDCSTPDKKHESKSARTQGGSSAAM